MKRNLYIFLFGLISCSESPSYLYKVYRADTYTRVAILNYEPIEEKKFENGLRKVLINEGLDSAYIFIDALTLSKCIPGFTEVYFSEKNNIRKLKKHSYDTTRLLKITEIGVGEYKNNSFLLNEFADSAYFTGMLVL